MIIYALPTHEEELIVPRSSTKKPLQSRIMTGIIEMNWFLVVGDLFGLYATASGYNNRIWS